MSKLVTGLLIAAAAAIGMYAAAATIATTLAANFTPTPAPQRPRIVEFAEEVKQAWNEHKSARARCARLNGQGKDQCNAEAKSEQRRALAEARFTYKNSIAPPVRGDPF